MTRRKKTDGERIAERMVEGWALSRARVDATAKAIDRLIRKRMGEAWDQGNVSYLKDNPYRGRKK
jgi:hypothetical protein